MATTTARPARQSQPAIVEQPADRPDGAAAVGRRSPCAVDVLSSIVALRHQTTTWPVPPLSQSPTSCQSRQLRRASRAAPRPRRACRSAPAGDSRAAGSPCTPATRATLRPHRRSPGAPAPAGWPAPGCAPDRFAVRRRTPPATRDTGPAGTACAPDCSARRPGPGVRAITLAERRLRLGQPAQLAATRRPRCSAPGGWSGRTPARV